MAGRQRDSVIKALCSKGFVREEGAKHIKLFLVDNSGADKGIMTVFSRGASDLSDSIVARVAFQLRLSSAEFRMLVDCAITASGYLDLLRRKGFPV